MTNYPVGSNSDIDGYDISLIRHLTDRIKSLVAIIESHYGTLADAMGDLDTFVADEIGHPRDGSVF